MLNGYPINSHGFDWQGGALIHCIRFVKRNRCAAEEEGLRTAAHARRRLEIFFGAHCVEAG
jgi:hypothetical protein